MQCADEVATVGDPCQDLLICVEEESDDFDRLRVFFPNRFLLPRPSLLSSFDGFLAGDCNVIAGDLIDISRLNLRQQGYVGEYQLGVNRYTRDPRALATRQDDPQWAQFIYWIVSTIFYADEEGIGQETADDIPLVRLLGFQFTNSLKFAIASVGSYSEIYERHAANEYPKGGPHLVNNELSGAQHFPLPGIQ